MASDAYEVGVAGLAPNFVSEAEYRDSVTVTCRGARHLVVGRGGVRATRCCAFVSGLMTTTRIPGRPTDVPKPSRRVLWCVGMTPVLGHSTQYCDSVTVSS